VESMYAVGDNISKISTSCMIKMIWCLLFTCLCYNFFIYVIMIACVRMGNFL
jgi:hypothetical protein